MRVAILSSADGELAHGARQDGLAVQALAGQVDALERALVELGHECVRVEAAPDLARTARELVAARADLVFHCAESIGGDARAEALVASMLVHLGLAHTGSSAGALSNALEKPRARALLIEQGIAVPRGFVLEDAQAPLPLELGSARWIVKPSREDASHGIARASVVSNESELRARVRHVLATYAQPALVEEFLEGREFNVALLGTGERTRVLPLAEIDFTHFPAGAPRLVTYEAKWVEDSEDYRGTPSVPARALNEALEQRIRTAALGAWRALGLAGYGRVDLRLDAHELPRVLDVNPNPDLSPGAGLARAAARAQISYVRLIDAIVQDALARAPARLANV